LNAKQHYLSKPHRATFFKKTRRGKIPFLAGFSNFKKQLKEQKRLEMKRIKNAGKSKITILDEPWWKRLINYIGRVFRRFFS
jgi:hypothetical protein